MFDSSSITTLYQPHRLEDDRECLAVLVQSGHTVTLTRKPIGARLLKPVVLIREYIPHCSSAAMYKESTKEHPQQQVSRTFNGNQHHRHRSISTCTE